MEYKSDVNEMTDNFTEDYDEARTEREELLYLRKKVRAYDNQLKRFEEMLEYNQIRKKPDDYDDIMPEEDTIAPEDDEDTIEGQFTLMRRQLDGLEQLISNGIYVEMMKRLDELEEKAHTDCIKVYRNVQAVVVEELSKQNKVIARDDKIIGKIKNKMRLILIFSIISLIASIAVIVIEILPVFGINLLP